MTMASLSSLSVDIATTFASLTSRHPTTLRSTILPFLLKPQRTHHPVLKTTPPFHRRRFSVSATATTSAPQTDDSDLTTKIPPDNRIPATIITGFLGSGKVLFLSSFLSFILFFCAFHLIYENGLCCFMVIMYNRQRYLIIF
jgi:hypothetical protein